MQAAAEKTPRADSCFTAFKCQDKIILKENIFQENELKRNQTIAFTIQYEAQNRRGT